MLTQIDTPQAAPPPGRNRGDASDEAIAARPDFLSAINLCIEVSGLQDNQIAPEIGMDEAHFSRCRRGKSHFPVNKIAQLEEYCENEIPTRWMAMYRGYGLVRLRWKVEEENAQLRRTIEALNLKIAHFAEFSGAEVTA